MLSRLRLISFRIFSVFSSAVATLPVCRSIFTDTTRGTLCGAGYLPNLVEQAWEMGKGELTLMHGHGRNRDTMKSCVDGFTMQH